MNGLCKDQPDISGYAIDYAEIYLASWQPEHGPSRAASRKKDSGQPRPDSQPDGSQRRRQPAPTVSAAPTDGPKVDHPGRGYPDPEAGGPNRARLPAGAGTVAL
jgi:hypothetical protein